MGWYISKKKTRSRPHYDIGLTGFLFDKRDERIFRQHYSTRKRPHLLYEIHGARKNRKVTFLAIPTFLIFTSGFIYK